MFFSTLAVAESDIRIAGYIELEQRSFLDSALYSGQHKHYTSLAIQPELSLGWDDGNSGVVFTPFIRGGDPDEERNHTDIRELFWFTAADDWELRAGIGKLFWGVTESLHLVDIVNQTDLIENNDGEDKLGQPMIQFSLMEAWGTVDMLLLPVSRERTFAGREGRLRPALVVDSDQTRYQSDRKEHHLDWAVRWSHYIDDYDFSLSHFSGTARTPQLLLGVDGDGRPVLLPYYPLIDQSGFVGQAILDDWLLKLELISVEQQDARHTAAVTGLEYTHVGVMESVVDLGIIVEYLFDDRHEHAPTPFEDDLMLGLRWAFNDVNSSEILMGVIYDLSDEARNYNIEASRRLGQNLKLSAEYRAVAGLDTQEPLYPLRKDGYLQLSLAYFF